MVKCKDCGFLAVCLSETNELVIADSKYRSEGSIPIVFIARQGERQRYSREPICSLNICGLPDELGTDPTAHGLLEVINKERGVHRMESDTFPKRAYGDEVTTAG